MSLYLYPKSKLPLREVQKFILIFYTVGIIGFLIPYTKNIFIAITPFALLLGTYLLAIYHKPYSKKVLAVLLIIFTVGFLAEVIGVNTGLIFGDYSYGSALGIKIFDTPLLIGINWLFLTYTSVSIISHFFKKEVLIVFLSSFLMLLYDFLLEQVAAKMDMWSWQGSEIPLKNYITWYFFWVLFVALLRVVKVNTKNPIAPILFAAQFVFFIFLNCFL